MDISKEQALKLARDAEQRLLATLKGPDATSAAALDQILGQLQDYRVLCEKILLGEFRYAFENRLEAQLWAAHVQVNNNYRKYLGQLRKASTRVVEIRKVARHYVGFLKSSQRFYRLYIHHLDSTYGGIPELRQVARKLHEEASTTPSEASSTGDLKQLLLQSCYQTLIQLGDLSRYRETDVPSKDERNWGPATGYYNLALEIMPESGVAHNQLAIIARTEGNHFRTIYHLYRSLAAPMPNSLAKQNLEVEFKKVLTAWKKGELINNRNPQEKNRAGRVLIAWFIRLHSKCYKGQEFSEREELENEVLSHLVNELKERSLDGILHKMVLTNIAAENYATLLLTTVDGTSTEVMTSYFYFLRLNMKMFFTLLRILAPELERLTDPGESPATEDKSSSLSDKVSPVARRILPALRLYSIWFTRYWRVLNANLSTIIPQVEVQELWKAYAETLTLLASAFPAQDLPEEQYLLEEDVDTLGFTPLLAEETKRIWYTNGQLKPRWSDEGLQRNHPNVEMLMRIRDLLLDGLVLTQDNDVPLALNGYRFIYQEAGIPSELLASPPTKADASPPLPAVQPEVPRTSVGGAFSEDQASQGVAPSESASVTQDAKMNRMVDDLVGPEAGLAALPEEDENIPPTPPEQTFEDTTVVDDTTYGIGPLTAEDFVKKITNNSRSQPRCGQQGQNPTGQVRTVSPAARQFPSLPSLPDQSKIWSAGFDNYHTDPQYSTFGHGTQQELEQQYTSNTHLPRVSNGHSRNLSTDSVWNPESFPDFSTFSTFPRSLPRDSSLGNGTFGDAANAAYGAYGAGYSSFSNSSSAYAAGYGYGASSVSPWNRERGPFTRHQDSPANGQGG